MDDFRWSDFANLSLLERYPPAIGGLALVREWQAGLLGAPLEAAAWHDPRRLRPSDLPDYLHLGGIFTTEGDIRSYCAAIRSAASLECIAAPSDPWMGPQTKPLLTD